jgi:hypothetical protein
VTVKDATDRQTGLDGAMTCSSQTLKHEGCLTNSEANRGIVCGLSNCLEVRVLAIGSHVAARTPCYLFVYLFLTINFC